MAYCPEDGTKMECVVDTYWRCYTCPQCNTHWEYDGDNGSYRAVQGDDCAACGEVFSVNPMCPPSRCPACGFQTTLCACVPVDGNYQV